MGPHFGSLCISKTKPNKQKIKIKNHKIKKMKNQTKPKTVITLKMPRVITTLRAALVPSSLRFRRHMPGSRLERPPRPSPIPSKFHFGKFVICLFCSLTSPFSLSHCLSPSRFFLFGICTHFCTSEYHHPHVALRTSSASVTINSTVYYWYNPSL